MLLADLAFIAVVVLAPAFLIVKMVQSNRRSAELLRLQEAYRQLDQQAKLIIRTDFDLHRTQEELDRRLAFLMALQRFGRQLQVSVQPAQVYGMLDAESVTQFGFTKGLLGLCASVESLEWHSLIGVARDTATQLADALTRYEMLGLGSKFMDEYPKRLRHVTVEQANAAIRKYFDPTHVVITVAGAIAK